MATMKVTMIFSDGGAGWTESFYLRDADADPDASEDVVQQIAAERAAGLAKGNAPFAPLKLEAIRVCNTATPNVCGLFPANPNVREANKDNPEDMCGTRTAVLSMYSAGKLHGRKYGLRGLPADWIFGDLDARRSNKQTTFLRDFTDQYTLTLVRGFANGSTVALRVQGYVQPGGVAHPVAAVTVDGVLGLWKITVPGLPGTVKVGSRIKITGLKGPGLQKINGLVTVYARTGDVLTITKRPCSLCTIIIKNPGDVLTLGPVTYPGVVEAFLSGYGEHKTGRAFFVRRGRRKCKTCRD